MIIPKKICNKIAISKNNTFEKDDDLFINANIELFDIYNNVNKSITIERLRKCTICKGIGKVINNHKI